MRMSADMYVCVHDIIDYNKRWKMKAAVNVYVYDYYSFYYLDI